MEPLHAPRISTHELENVNISTVQYSYSVTNQHNPVLHEGIKRRVHCMKRPPARMGDLAQNGNCGTSPVVLICIEHLFLIHILDPGTWLGRRKRSTELVGIESRCNVQLEFCQRVRRTQ